MAPETRSSIDPGSAVVIIDDQVDSVLIAVQVAGKTRDNVSVPAGASQAEAEEAARASERVSAFLKDAEPKRIIYVPGRIINFVI